ncbi:7TM GPCR domain containing protein [Aphelenchoides bicaudatus]|nr:7TM GPCR domain containing protein [Aphelenchoides bicaudatus]
MADGGVSSSTFYSLKGFAQNTHSSRPPAHGGLATTTAPTLSSFLLEMVDSTSIELSSVEMDEGGPECTHISEAIKAQGIDDLTSETSIQALFGLAYGILFFLGLCGNGGVLLAVAQNKRLRSARNIFLLNLILTDLLLCLTAIPVTPWYALTKEWIFGSFMCRLMPLSTSCAVFVTSWSLTAIAVDKFIHIIDPTREQFSVRFAGIVTVLIWVFCILVNIPYVTSFKLVDGSYYTMNSNATPFCGQFCDEINWQGDMRRLYGSTVMLFQFVIPLGIITYCYWRILAKVHKDMIIQNVEFSQSLTTTQRCDAIKRKKRVNYILIAMVAAFILCWLPLTAVNLARDFKREPQFIKRQPYLWSLFANCIAMSTVIWNPLLFFWLTRKQKRAHLGGILHTSEILTSLASRVHSLRSNGGTSVLGSTSFRIKRKPAQNTNDSDGAPGSNSGSIHHQSRPLIVNSTENGGAQHRFVDGTKSTSPDML